MSTRRSSAVWRRAANSHRPAPTIERLRHRLDVSVLQFARAKLRLRGGQARRLAVSTVGQALYGLQKLVSSMMADVFVRPGHRPRLPDSVAGTLTEILAPGDVLVVRKEYALTNYFLPGYWPHAALFWATRASWSGWESPTTRTFGRAGTSCSRPRPIALGVCWRP